MGPIKIAAKPIPDMIQANFFLSIMRYRICTKYNYYCKFQI